MIYSLSTFALRSVCEQVSQIGPLQTDRQTHKQTKYYNPRARMRLGLTTLSIGDNLNQAAIKSCNHETLGALIGLLAAALVGVTMGWIVSCVYWQRRITQR